LRKLLLDIRYSVSACAEKLGFANKVNLQYWNRISPIKFFMEGIGRNKYIQPHIFGRLKLLHSLGNMTLEKISHLNDSTSDFEKYIAELKDSGDTNPILSAGLEERIMKWPTPQMLSERFDRSIYYYHHHYNNGKIIARVSRKDHKLHISPRSFRDIILDLKYDYKSAAKRIGVKPSRLKNWNNYLKEPFFQESISGKNCVPPYIVGRLRLLNKESGSKMRIEILQHVHDSNEVFRDYIDAKKKNVVKYNPDNPPYYQSCEVGMAFIYNGREEGVIIGKKFDEYTPVVTVEMKTMPDPYKVMDFRVKNDFKAKKEAFLL
jgi:hypothetical protein